MSAEKLGPIEIEFLLDKKADQQAKQLKTSLDAIGVASGKSISSLKDDTKNQQAYIKGLTSEIKELQKAYDSASAGIGKSNIGKDLAQAKRTLREEQSQLIGLQEKQIAINNEEALSTGNLSSQIGKWALSLGGAAAILTVLKKALLETTGGLNAFNIVSALTQQFLYNIVSGTEAWTSNLTSAIEVQRRFNALRTEGYVEEYKASVLNNKYQQAYSESLDATLSREDKIKKIDEALANHNEMIDLKEEHVRKSIEATQEALKNQPGSEKYKKEYAALMTELSNLEAQRYESTKRLVRQRSILIKEGDDEELKWAKDLHEKLQKLADEQIEINNSVAEQEKLLQQTVINGSDAEIKAITKRILKLREEEELRSRIAKHVQDALAFQGFIPDVAPASNIKTPAFGIHSTLPSGTGKTPAQIKAEMSSLRKLGPEYQDSTEQQERLNKSTKIELKTRQEILGAVSDLVMQLGVATGLDEKSLTGLSNGLATFTSALSGDWLGTVQSVISNLITLIPDAAAKFQDQIDAINLSLQVQQNLIDQSERSGGGKQAREDKIKLLEQKEQSLINQLRYAAGQGKPTEQILADLLAVRAETAAAEQDLQDFLIGGITQNSIGSAIINGLAEGKTGIADFTETFAEQMKTAIDASIEELSKPVWDEWYKKFTEDMASGGGLDDSERAALKAEWDKNVADEKARRDEAYRIAGMDPTSATAAQSSSDPLKGSIKGITEKTADVLAGQGNAVRIDVNSIASMMRQQLLHSAEIAANTRYNKHLESIDNKLDALSSNSLRPQGLA